MEGLKYSSDVFLVSIILLPILFTIGMVVLDKNEKFKGTTKIFLSAIFSTVLCGLFLVIANMI